MSTSSFATNQQIDSALQYSESQYHKNTLKIGIVVVKESTSEVNEWINTLFRFHLSHKTLHFYIIFELKKLIKICQMMSTMNYKSNLNHSNEFCVSNAHSLNIIKNMVTEDATINGEISRAIAALWKDRAIVKTFELIKILYKQTTDQDINTNKFKNKKQLLYLTQLSNVLFKNDLKRARKQKNSEYTINVQFCEYFFTNCKNYSITIAENLRYAWNATVTTGGYPIIFDQKTWIDYKLLKNHIIEQNNGQPLCYAGKNLYFHIWKLSHMILSK